jgi:L-ascorbate metabolism protein UlaG (beta-lactamase superfamily)
MRLSVHGHACVRIDDESGVVVIDPGVFSAAGALERADAVLVTHDHADHVDAPAVVAWLAARSSAHAWAPANVVDLLLDAGADGSRVHAVAAGDAVRVAGHDVDVLGEDHAVIHADIPVGPNVGYVIDGAILHPGDAFVRLPGGADIDVLLTPISGPWLKLAEVVDYVRDIAPRRVVPIHDVLLSDIGRAGALRMLGPEALGSGRGYEIVDGAGGAEIEVAARPSARAALVGDEIHRVHPEFDDVPELEADESAPPRPEEDAADAARH